jgi:hypothetical protein
MLSFDEVDNIIDKIVNDMPGDIFKWLNGGVVLVPHEKLHPESDRGGPGGELYILGEYNNDPRGLGRYIVIYYGSFVRLHGWQTPDRQEDELRKVINHELTHHLESLAGERDLEKQDARDLMKYKKRSRQ